MVIVSIKDTSFFLSASEPSMARQFQISFPQSGKHVFVTFWLRGEDVGWGGGYQCDFAYPPGC